MDAYTTVKRYNDLVGICIDPPSNTTVSNKSFHIAFLIDTSGSMAGQRLDTVKQTLQLFIDQMGSGASTGTGTSNRVTLISYNAAAQLLCKAEASRACLREHVENLRAGGGTNIESALCRLLEVDVPMDGIFLLTDGEVNQGIRSVKGLEALARSTSRGIPVYTVGYGDDHNARLLQAIALATRASYTFAETHEMIPSVAGAILVAMRDEVAKGVVVEWEGTATCWELGSGSCASGSSTNSYTVGTIISNKSQWVILKEEVAGSITAIRVSATMIPSVSLAIPPPSPSEANDAGDLDVLEQWFRVKSVAVFTEIQDMCMGAGRGITFQANTMAALAKLAALENEITTDGAAVQDRPLIHRIRAEITEQRDHLDNLGKLPASPAGDTFNRRLTATTTAFAMQRGHMDMFNSPAQREVSGSMVAAYTQSQDPC